MKFQFKIQPFQTEAAEKCRACVRGSAEHQRVQSTAATVEFGMRNVECGVRNAE
jgi:hypothetical protein